MSRRFPSTSQAVPLDEQSEDEPRAALSSYELAAPPVVLPRPRSLEWAEHRRPRPHLDSVWDLLKDSALGASRLRELSFCLVALSVADILVTFTLLRTSHAFYESNPLAQWFYAKWNMTGMVVFKFSSVATAIVMGEIIERRRPGWGRLVMVIGCVAATAVVWHGLRLYLGVGGLPIGGTG